MCGEKQKKSPFPTNFNRMAKNFGESNAIAKKRNLRNSNAQL